ncbi:MAG: HupE/UreJ family protein [Desulfuromonadaceae bacterium]
MKLSFSSILFGLIFFIATLSVAEAHTFGAQGAGFAEGLAHPFIGLDHLLAMLAVGLWAAQLGGKAKWFVPTAFVGVMASSAWLASVGLAVMAGMDPAIAGSVIILGLLVAFRVRLPVEASAGLVGLFAAFHGMAHGMEIPQTASPLVYGLGFVTATAMLHGIGLCLGLAHGRSGSLLSWGGSMIALTGLFLLATA